MRKGKEDGAEEGGGIVEEELSMWGTTGTSACSPGRRYRDGRIVEHGDRTPAVLPVNMDDGQEPQGHFFGPEADEEAVETSPVAPWRCTMEMQEMVAAALVHTLSCGLTLIDNDALANVRGAV